MAILTQFLLRMSFGLALCMAMTSPRQVTSGYFRNHLYVLLGLTALATLVAISSPSQFPLVPPLAAAILSYIGSVVWLYEKPRVGVAVLAILAGVSLAGAVLAAQRPSSAGATSDVLAVLDPASGGLVLGCTLAAMFLGHWYLNTPTMVLDPLRKLVVVMAAAIVVRMLVCGTALGLALAAGTTMPVDKLLFLSLRWLSGLIGALLLSGMAWQTLKIPNTQSSTGILYVAVIVTFLGELMSLLLSAGGLWPL